MKTETTFLGMAYCNSEDFFVSTKVGLIAFCEIYPLDTVGKAAICFSACQILFVRDSIDRDEKQGICLAIFGLN